MKHGHWRHGFVALALLFILSFAACQRDSDRVEVFPVTGECFYQGNPATGAQIVLHPDGGSAEKLPHAFPHATVDEKGTFNISTYDPGDGAPPGKYMIVVRWPTSDAAEESSEEEQPTDDEGVPISTDRLNGRYADPNKSTLPVVVESKPNQLQRIELK